MDKTKKGEKLPYSTPFLNNLLPWEIDPILRLSFAKVKYLYLSDKHNDSRTSFLRTIFEQNDVFYEYKIYDDVIPKSNIDTDIIIFGGNDYPRLSHILKCNRLLINSAVKICANYNASVADRSYIFRAGFDMSLDTKSANIEVSRHQISAIHLRYIMTQDISKLEEDIYRKLSEYTDYGNLTPQQKSVFNCLFKHRNRPVYYSVLCETASVDHIPISINHLKVLINALRARMHYPEKIINVRDVGYSLLS